MKNRRNILFIICIFCSIIELQATNNMTREELLTNEAKITKFFGIYHTNTVLMPNCKIIKSQPISRIFWYEFQSAENISKYLMDYKNEIQNEAINNNWDAVVSFKTTSINEGGVNKYVNYNKGPVKTQIVISGVTILEGVKVMLECK